MSFHIRGTTLPLFMLVLACVGCRTDEGPTLPSSLLNSPTIVVPVGALRGPQGVVVDATGDVWVADTFSDAVRRYSSSGATKALLPGIVRPRMMGFDRYLQEVLVVSDRQKVYRIDPSGNTTAVLFDAATNPIDTSSVFNLRNSSTGPHAVSGVRLGDVDGAIGGDLFVSASANSGENVVLRIQGTQCSALAYSPIRAVISADIASRFLSVDRFGTIFTCFVTYADQQVTETYAFGLFPTSLGLSAALPSGNITTGQYGSGIDNSGILFIADAISQQLVILSSSSGQTLETIPIPPITGLARPSPRDASVAADGSVYVSLTDLADSSNSVGAVIRFTRSLSQ